MSNSIILHVRDFWANCVQDKMRTAYLDALPSIGSIPAIPYARNVPSLLFHGWLNEACLLALL